ncbi:MAG: hypothetical protein LBJ00_01190 [Planctomycetaceae bacterium]|jgi:hypothetical protein|nr:hypothetical protein [Planctomycetaceae bacterium]
MTQIWGRYSQDQKMNPIRNHLYTVAGRAIGFALPATVYTQAVLKFLKLDTQA